MTADRAIQIGLYRLDNLPTPYDQIPVVVHGSPYNVYANNDEYIKTFDLIILVWDPSL